jgi:hypothetical protein
MSNRKTYLMGVVTGVAVTGAAAFMVGMGQPGGIVFVTGDGHRAYLWSASGGKLTFVDMAQAKDDEHGKKEEGEKGKKDDESKGKPKGK